jgi:hypothetical protein
MDKSTWTAVDQYLNEKLIGPDDNQESTLRANADAQLSSVHARL